jgi:glycosyltransferase involved in cell wall biosynthesis
VRSAGVSVLLSSSRAETEQAGLGVPQAKVVATCDSAGFSHALCQVETPRDELGTRILVIAEAVEVAAAEPAGAAAVVRSHLDLLSHGEQEAQVDLLAISFGQQPSLRVPDWLSKRCSSVSFVDLPNPERRMASFPNPALTLLRPMNALWCFDQGTVGKLRAAIATIAPRLMLGEHLLPTAFAMAAKTDVPVVYSHLDWLWLIKRLRTGESAKSIRYRLRNQLLRRAELCAVRQASGCLSVSATEAEQIKEAGAKKIAYIPTTYECARPRPRGAGEAPRIVHFGGMRATANRLGLLRFLEVVWPEISDRLWPRPRLLVVGALSDAPSALVEKLEGAGAECAGYVPDLGEVLRAGDINVIPWEHNTGGRTRIPMALNYKNAVVSTRAGAACYPELVHGRNCVLVDGLEPMGAEICRLMRNEGERERIAQNGKETFLRCFTREAVQPRFDAFVRSLFSRRGER